MQISLEYFFIQMLDIF